MKRARNNPCLLFLYLSLTVVLACLVNIIGEEIELRLFDLKNEEITTVCLGDGVSFEIPLLLSLS